MFITLNKYHRRRLVFILLVALGLSCAATLILSALKQNINVFVTPSDIAVSHPSYAIRLGGIVKKHSVRRAGLTTTFVVTDFKQDRQVTYHGILPDLFREGSGVIAEGKINSQNILQATRILAKHDENYMPPALNPLTKTAQS